MTTTDDPRHQPAHHRPLRTQHDPGLSGSRRGQGGGVRILRAQAAGAARLSARRRPRGRARLSRDAAFSAAEIDWLKRTGRFRDNLLDYLAAFRFTGDVHAIPEGTACFPNEPLMRITAPLPQAQLVETRLINILHYQTLIASKAARMVLAAPGKMPVRFRPAHRARRRSRAVFGARELHRRLCRRRQCAGRRALRHPDRRHHGAFLRAGARRRDAGLRGFRAGAAGRRHPADRHLRHRGRRAQSRRARAAAARPTASPSAACASTAAI